MNTILKTHLQALAEAFKSNANGEYYQFIIDNGTTYIERNREHEPCFNVEQKSCYNNSILCHHIDLMKYVEGYALFKFGDGDEVGFPIEHAWNIDSNGRVVDTTSNEFGFEATEYFGVVVPLHKLDAIESPTFYTPLQSYYNAKKNELFATE